MDATGSAQQRAAAAEDAVLAGYVHRYGPVAWARAAAAAGDGARTWHYWWHAHLVHALSEAERHRPSAARRRLLGDVVRGITVRTAGTWTTPFYDDIAWMGLALAEARPRAHARARIARVLVHAIDPEVGALPWRTGSVLYNAPANGPAAMVLAPSRHRARARELADWIAATLDDDSGLVRDGIEHGVVRPDLWTYNQGVAVGAAVALDDPDRAAAVIRAVQRWCADDDGLFPAAGGGDGGLFAGILARYLAVASTSLGGEAADRSRRLVHRNAVALWEGRRDGRFPADPRRPAQSAGDDLDLSVQLGAWMTLEADVTASERLTS